MRAPSIIDEMNEKRGEFFKGHPFIVNYKDFVDILWKVCEHYGCSRREEALIFLAKWGDDVDIHLRAVMGDSWCGLEKSVDVIFSQLKDRPLDEINQAYREWFLKITPSQIEELRGDASSSEHSIATHTRPTLTHDLKEATQ